MPITLNGTGTIGGILPGGLPDSSVTTDDVANAAITPSKLSQPLTLGTVQNATGTSVDFTGIPSWARRVTVMFNGVSTNGTSLLQVQAGAGSILTTGYVSSSSTNGANVSSTTGFVAGANNGAADARSGVVVLSGFGANAWLAAGAIGNGTNCSVISGTVTLSGTLDRIRITTVNGTDQFDAGTINVMWE